MTARAPRTERYRLEVGTMHVRGVVTNHDDGTCTVGVHYQDRATTNNQIAEYRHVDRQTLADLYRAFADNLEPEPEGTPHTFWCGLHQAELEGMPVWENDPFGHTWEVSFDLLECAHDAERRCRPSWVAGHVAVPRKGVA